MAHSVAQGLLHGQGSNHSKKSKRKSVHVEATLSIAGLVMNFLKGTGFKTKDDTGRSVKRQALTADEFVKILRDDLEEHKSQV